MVSDTEKGVIAHLTVAGAMEAAAFYVAAFGATEAFRMPDKTGTRLMFCRLELNGGPLFLSDDFPEHSGGASRAPQGDNGSPITLHLEVADCDAVFARAVAAGARGLMEPADMFWGARYAQVLDPFGHRWSIGQTLEGAAPSA